MPPGGDGFQTQPASFTPWGQLCVPTGKMDLLSTLRVAELVASKASGQCPQQGNSTIPMNLLPLVTYAQESHSSRVEGGEQPDP